MAPAFGGLSARAARRAPTPLGLLLLLARRGDRKPFRPELVEDAALRQQGPQGYDGDGVARRLQRLLDRRDLIGLHPHVEALGPGHERDAALVGALVGQRAVDVAL